LQASDSAGGKYRSIEMAKPVRPGWLTAVAVIGIVLGAIGILAAIVGVVGQIFAEQMQQWTMQWVRSMSSMGSAGQAVPADVLQMQEELQRLIIDIQRRWRGVLISLLVVNLVLSVLLVTSGVATLRLVAWGRALLIVAFAGTIVYEAAQLVPTLMIQHETTLLTQQYMSKVLAASQSQTGGIPPGMNTTMAAFSQATFAISFVMAAGWALVKIALYGAAIYYLRTPLIRSLFANQRGAVEVQAIES
jgi:hypothetical protein